MSDRVNRVVRHVLVSNVHLRLIVVAQVPVVLTRRQGALHQVIVLLLVVLGRRGKVGARRLLLRLT